MPLIVCGIEQFQVAERIQSQLVRMDNALATPRTRRKSEARANEIREMDRGVCGIWAKEEGQPKSEAGE